MEEMKEHLEYLHNCSKWNKNRKSR